MSFAIPATSTWRVSSTPIRFRGLDTLRGIAAILVVLLHAGIPYMTRPLTYLVWPARDIHPSSIVDGLTWCTECFLMPLFFVLAGFFSMGLLVSRGERSFLAGRTKRLLRTQLTAGLVILPTCLFIWSLGWMADGLYVPEHCVGFELPSELKAELFGMGHLWFLQYLYLYCVILCGISWLAKRFVMPEQAVTAGENHSFCRLDRVLMSAWKPLIPAIPCAMILYCDTRVVLGFYQTFNPVLSKLAYYAIYFFVGAMIYRHREALHLHARFGKTYLVIAGLLFTVTLPLIHEHLTLAFTGVRLALLAGLLALFAWLTTFGLFAVFLRTEYGDNAVTRYLAEASFWIYLIHLPFVGLTQVAIAQLPIPTLAKFLLAGMTALMMALMTYHVFVRHTWLGEFLDGHQRSRKPVTLELQLAESQYPIVTPHYANSTRTSRSVQGVMHRMSNEG